MLSPLKSGMSKIMMADGHHVLQTVKSHYLSNGLIDNLEM